MSQKMNRRALIKSSAAVIVGSTVGLAGCSGGSSSPDGSSTPTATSTPELTREVTAPEDIVELSNWSAGVEEADGSQAFVVEFDLKNVSEQKYFMEVEGEFYDGDGTVLGQQKRTFPLTEQLEPGDSLRAKVQTTSSPEEVRRYVITIDNTL